MGAGVRGAVREVGGAGVGWSGYRTGRDSALGRYSAAAARPLMFSSPNETNR